MSASPKVDQLIGIMQVGTTLKILFLQASHIHQQLLGSRLAGKQRDCCFALFRCYQPFC